uniref:Type II toxin-antitoxin system RelE/ParE family toxin n=1 Tax=candidate division CPR3 bacterium TaxID=2268181 RepID=A0A7C4R858_UNCC3
MNRIEKFLKKINLKEKIIIDSALDLIFARDFCDLNLKKLVDHENCYRVRKGKFRIVFTMEGENIKIIDIDKKNASTYKNLD